MEITGEQKRMFVIGGVGVIVIALLVLFSSQGVINFRKKSETELGGEATATPRTDAWLTHELSGRSYSSQGVPEQDVFILGGNASEVVRIRGDMTNAEMVYSAAAAVLHDPLQTGKSPLGPYPIGKPLGFTMGQWLSASGSGTYALRGEMADVKLNFVKLVPGGVYTILCARVTSSPNLVVTYRHCGASDGSQNFFKADAGGGASFALTMSPLEDSTDTANSNLVLAYRSDGKDHDSNIGELGVNTHLQMSFFIPPTFPF